MSECDLLKSLVDAGLLKISGETARLCVPQYRSCLECPFVRVIDYDEILGGEDHIIPLNGICGFSGDALPNFDILPECPFLKNAIDKLQKFELWKKQRKIEKTKNLYSDAEKLMDILSNPHNHVGW